MFQFSPSILQGLLGAQSTKVRRAVGSKAELVVGDSDKPRARLWDFFFQRYVRNFKSCPSDSFKLEKDQIFRFFFQIFFLTPAYMRNTNYHFLQLLQIRKDSSDSYFRFFFYFFLLSLYEKIVTLAVFRVNCYMSSIAYRSHFN